MNKPVLCYLLLSLISLPLSGQTPAYGSVTDIDGNVYRTVKIGKFEWMAENLKVTTYNVGTDIPMVSVNDTWPELSSGAYCWYDNDISYAQTYGALYNWFAVETGKLCPDGWRVPADLEWNYLEAEADSRYVQGDLEWYKPALLRGYDAAKNLKADAGWGSGGNGTDPYGFSALPGGERRVSDGAYFQAGRGGFWWSATEKDSSEAWFRSMAYSFEQVARNIHPKNFGFSVRCLREAE